MFALSCCNKGSRMTSMAWFRGLLIAALGACVASAVQAQPDFYAGKRITISVGATPGGGYDIYARAIAPVLSELIPGKPNVVVQNMPGAGSLTSVLWLDTTAPKDGTAITIFNAGVITETSPIPRARRPI
jgi:tripartite-type tricarboxylate transporter receptor subunit TctC